MEKIESEGWPNCIRLANRDIELVITTDVGPRIIRFGFINGENLLYISDKEKGQTGGSQWRLYGGHRLWHAPEVMPRTYFPDNNPVNYAWNGKTLKLTQKIESTTGIIKEIEITLDQERNEVKLLHRLINNNPWTIELSPWAITAMAPGGKAILPQEPYIDPALFLLPARPVVLWHYTRMTDRRWTWGNKFIQMVHDPSLATEQKIGILNKQGWAAYSRENILMIKRFDFHTDTEYPDYGCNNEIYVNGDFLEIETLGAVQKVNPGNAAEHTEHWLLANPGKDLTTDDEDRMEQIMLSILNSFVY